MHRICLAFAFTLLITGTARAHIPFFERGDFSEEAPFESARPVETSIAVYAWLHDAGDVDLYRFAIQEPTDFYANTLVPEHPALAHVYPRFALVGPGLPEPEVDLPLSLPGNCGAVVVRTLASEPRETFYEPFGGKSYYRGPSLEMRLEHAGEYHVVVWEPEGNPCDYVMASGDQERWEGRDILRALWLTPQIRMGRELHTIPREPTIADRVRAIVQEMVEDLRRRLRQ